MEKSEPKITKTGTTTIGIVCKDGIVMAADKRATAGGSFITHKAVDKIFLFTENSALTTAGNVSDIQFVLKMARSELKLKQLRTKTEPTIKEISSLFAMINYENIRKFSTLLGISAFLIGGVDKKGSWLFEIPPDGCMLEHKDYTADGSGSPMALGLLEDVYTPEITTKDGIRLAVRAITAAMHRDAASGSGIDVVVIDKNGAKKVLSEEVKEVLVKKN